MNRHLLLVLVSCSCFHVGSVRAYHAFLREILQPFMVCADENNIPRDKSLTGNLNNDIATLRLGYNETMNCIDAKLAAFRNSNDTLEWYIGHMFDINTTMHLKTNITDSNAYDFTCLDSDSQYYGRDLCFNSSYVALRKIMEISNQFNLSHEAIQNLVCNGGSFMRPGSCSTVGDECTPGIRDFLKNVLFPILVGKDCGSTRTTVTPIDSHGTPTSNDNIGDSALFYCGRLVFNDTLEQLFPPSECSISTVTNITAAKLQQQQSMQEFCSKRREYGQCVTQRIQRGSNFLDYLTGNIISTVTLEKAFDIYCENQDLISSQYECTFNAVSGGNCSGGVDDLLVTGATNIRKMSSLHLCRELKRAVSCRLQTQLNQCSPQFVSVMFEFYNSILGEECYPAGFRPNHPMTDVLKCYANYYLGSQKRIANYFSGLNQTVTNNGSDVMVIVAKEMEHICENDIEDIADCMYNIYASPKKPQDILAAKLIAARNIKPLARRTCALVPALKPNIECIANGFGALINQSDNCLVDFTEKVAQVTTGMMNGTEVLEDVDKVADLMCKLLGSVKPCLIPVFTSCDRSLGNSIGTLFDDMMAACNNPSYRLKEKDNDGKSSSSKLSYTFSLAFISFIFTIL